MIDVVVAIKILELMLAIVGISIVMMGGAIVAYLIIDVVKERSKAK